MKYLTKKLNKKIEKLEEGKLELNEIEDLVDSAKELYERLIVIRHKAYEKFGEPELEKEALIEVPEVAVEENEVVAVEEKEEAVEAEPSFDFSGGISEEAEQPAFDFSAGEDEPEDEPVLQKSDDFSVKSHDEKIETFPIADDVKTNTSDIFKGSHIEKHEPEDPNTLNEKLKSQEDSESLRKKLQHTPITDLKSEISIAKKFEYITFMFDGKNEIYEEAISTLNNCADGEEAKNKLSEYSTKYNWDLENKSIMKFVELVERRYL